MTAVVNLATDHQLGLQCEVCDLKHPGGIARGVVLDEPEPELGFCMLFDGWTLAEHSDIAVCPEHQSDPLVKTIMFAE